MRGRIALFWVLPLLLLLACGDDDPAGPPGGGGNPVPAGIKLSATSLTIAAVGDSSQLTTTVEDASGQAIANATVTWESEDEDVAIVRTTGWVVAQGEGTTNVVAKAGSVSSSATVTVKVEDDEGGSGGTAPARIELTPGTLTLVAIEDSALLAPKVEDADGKAISGVTVTWQSTDEKIAVVRPSGWVVATGDGTAKIVATVGSISDTATVKVERVPAQIVPDKDEVWVGEGRTETVTVVVQDANGYEIPGAEVKWWTWFPQVATVEDGVVTGVGVAARRRSQPKRARCPPISRSMS